MGYPVHKFLEDFDDDERALSNIVRSLRPKAEAAASERAIQRRIDEAYARGLEEGRAEAEAQRSTELAILREDCENRLEQSKVVFCDNLTDRLTSELRRQIDNVHASIDQQLVSALLPVLRHVLTEATVKELAHGLNDILAEQDAITVELRGPQELVDRITDTLNRMNEMPQTNSKLKCVPDETSALSIIANDTVIEARLMSWIQRIAAVVE